MFVSIWNNSHSGMVMKSLERILIFGLCCGMLAGCAPSGSDNAPRDVPQVDDPAYEEAERASVLTADVRPAEQPGTPQAFTSAKNSHSSAKQSVKVDVVEYDPAPVTNDAFVLEEGFEALTLGDFVAIPDESNTWTATGDEIHSTGKPRGYLYSKDSFQNFTWRLEYRFERPTTLKDEAKFRGNTGFMIYISGEHKIWPVSLEVQGKHAEMAAIKANGGAAPVTVEDDDSARQAARRPVGQWNWLEIVSHDGALDVTLNGRPISRSEPNFLSEGHIGIQAEDHPFAVRRLRIRRD